MVQRVLLVTQWFDPEPTFKGLVFARELVRQGFEVEVVTGFPNYPGGNVYPGYRIRPVQHEMIDGVAVTRVALYPNHGHSAIKRVLNYASFGASSLCYLVFGARSADVIYAYHPPLSVGISACLAGKLRKTPVVYDVQDMWPETLAATGMVTNRRVLDFVGSVCRWVYRRVDHLVVLSPGFKRLLVDRGVAPSKLEVIYNWADESSLDAPRGGRPEGFPSAQTFNIVFAGNMGKAQALESVLDAAAMLQAKQSPVRWVLVGGGTEVQRLRQQAAQRGLSNVTFFPPVPMAEVGAYLRAADALLVHLSDDPLFRITIPSKTQAYLAVGKPILMAVAGDAADLVGEAGAGIRVTPRNASELAQAAENLAGMECAELEAMGRRGRQFYQDRLSLAAGVEKFGKIFRRFERRTR